MAGAGSRFIKAGYQIPKPFIDVNGKMMIERVLDSLKINDADYTLVIQKAFKIQYKDYLDILTRKYYVQYVEVEKMTSGACCTALAAHEIINNNEPVLFADSDNFFKNGIIYTFIDNSIKNNYDGALLTFMTDKPCFSYAQIDENGLVILTREKEVISNHAITGIYYFKKGSDFVKFAISMLIYGDLTKNEYYMSNVYNYAIRAKKRIGIMDIGKDDWCCVGTPEQLNKYLLENT